MQVGRIFLGWNEHPLKAAAEVLVADCERQGVVDLSGLLLVAPSFVAGRVLLEQLVEIAEQRSAPLFPPRIITPDDLPESLYRRQRSFASPLIRHMTWAHCLKRHRRMAQHLPQPPDDDDIVGWLQLGRWLDQRCDELAIRGLRLNDLGQHAPKMKKSVGRGPTATPRWKYFTEVQNDYLAQLASIRLADRSYARIEAIRQKVCRTDRQIVLVAIADLEPIVHTMLMQVRGRVTSLVAAPDGLAHRFDDLGCVVPDAWQDVVPAVEDRQITLVEGSLEQARAVVAQLNQWSTQFAVDEIGVAVPDAALVAEVERHLLARGVPCHWWPRRKLEESVAWRLLDLLCEYLREPLYATFVALLRHPGVEEWLQLDPFRSSHLLQADRYYARHLPRQVGVWLGAPDRRIHLEIACGRLEDALEPFRRSPARLSAWAARVSELCAHVYGDRGAAADLREDSDLTFFLDSLGKVLTQIVRIPASLDPLVAGHQALTIILRQLEGMTLTHEPTEPCVQMVGWSDAPFVESSAVIVTSMNDGFIPSHMVGRSFLPEAMEEEVGAAEEQRRYARDLYWLELLQNSRRQLHVVVAKRDTAKNPVVPSRFLLVGDDDRMTRRCRWLFRDPVPSERDIEADADDIQAPTLSPCFVPPPQRAEMPIEAMNVTSFRDYLNCPYRYYLKHVLRLEPLHDDQEELPRNEFGTILHNVLERFGTSPLRDSESEEDLRAFLRDTLSKVVRDQISPSRPSAIEIQLKAMEHRLDAFAVVQAGRVRDGWRIEHIEARLGAESSSLVLPDGTTMPLIGRIDRIDRHVANGKYEVLDYKTSDAGAKPEETHRRSRQWIDLQLPLYRFLVEELQIPHDGMQMGYFLLPRDASSVGVSLTPWTEEELQSARQVAVNVAHQVRQQVFWPPVRRPHYETPEFVGICGQQFPPQG